MTNIQISCENARKVYGSLNMPLLSFMCKVHRITQREFALIFGISKSYAEEILKHRVLNLRCGGLRELNRTQDHTLGRMRHHVKRYLFHVVVGVRVEIDIHRINLHREQHGIPIASTVNLRGR